MLTMPNAASCQSLLFAYPERPPYNYTENGNAVGTLVELTRKILAEAGIDATFVEMPSKRILAEIQKDGSTLCSFGWFKTPEREYYVRYTLPIIRDTPLVAVFLKNNFNIQPLGLRLETLAANTNLSVGLVRGWTYGEHVDAVFKNNGTRLVEIPERKQQALMLALERFSYTLARESEIDEIIHMSGKPKEAFVVSPLEDVILNRNSRYIICGKGVPEDVVERINASIVKLCARQPGGADD